MDFKSKIQKTQARNDSLLCIGLDSDTSKMPTSMLKQNKPLELFNEAIIEATADLVCAYKLNSAMYEANGSDGIAQLQKSCEYLKLHYPDIPIILDFKRGDIGNTNSYYAQFAFDYLGVDAITISPYMGKEANKAFLAYKNKGIFVLCRTSNPGAGEFQDLEVAGEKLFEVVAKEVMRTWNGNSNCGLVVGSPYPEEQSIIRKLVGDDVIFLVPGVGAQGGSIEATVRSSLNSSKSGIIINSSRAIIFASNGTDFASAAAKEAKRTRDEINRYRN